MMNLGSNSSQDLNLVKMILNLDDNDMNDNQKIASVYDIYTRLSDLNFNQTFKDSLINSKNYLSPNFDIPMALNSLVKNNPNSFLIVPLSSQGHLWSTLIRRTDDGFSSMVINKGSSYFHDPVEEFVFKPENMDGLTKTLAFAGLSQEEDIEDVYRAFESNSNVAFNLKIDASSQKVGNCFAKNIQAAIKIAAATNQMSAHNLKTYRLKPYTPYGTHVLRKKTFKWNAPSTEDVQRKFSEQVALKNPHIKADIEEALKIYSENKRFREYLRQNREPVQALFLAFDPNQETAHWDRGDRIAHLLKNLTFYNYEAFPEKIHILVNASKKPPLMKAHQLSLRLLESYGYFSSNDTFLHFINAGHDPLKSLQRIFGSYPMDTNPTPFKIARLLQELSPDVLSQCKQEILHILSRSHAQSEVLKEYKKLLKSSREQHNREIGRLKQAKGALRHAHSCFPDVVRKLEENLEEVVWQKAHVLPRKNHSLAISLNP
jgi:hypothetical protein